MTNVLKNIINNASEGAKEISAGQTFYTDSIGLKHCTTCGKRLEHLISVPSLGIKNMKVNCICDCGKAQRDKFRKELKELEQDMSKPRIRAAAFRHKEMQDITFDKDTVKSKEGGLCRRWVMNYETNKGTDKEKWLFLYGGCGTGKTFYACCIANAMIDKGYSAAVVTPSDIEADIFGSHHKSDIYEKYSSYDILVIDDFAANRKSDYMYEILFTVVNDRYNARKPIIFTSNMTTQETANPQDIRVERIMSRIWERGYPIEFVGEDMRKGNWNADNHDTR